MPGFIPIPSAGVPADLDVAPCILFIVLYALNLPVVVYRLARSNLRWPLVHQRPLIFGSDRIAFYGIRLAAATNYSVRASKGFNLILEGFVLASWYALVHALVDLYAYHAARTSDAPRKVRDNRKNLAGLMHIYGLLVLPFGIVPGAMYGSAMDNPNSATIVTVFRFLLSSFILVVITTC
jgi:hypothetical protein